jgi:hypothetical protein
VSYSVVQVRIVEYLAKELDTETNNNVCTNNLVHRWSFFMDQFCTIAIKICFQEVKCGLHVLNTKTGSDTLDVRSMECYRYLDSKQYTSLIKCGRNFHSPP